MKRVKGNALMDLNLGEYSKSKPEDKRTEPWTTSVNLTQGHRKFLEAKNINFSELVRDFLDALMEREDK